MQINKPDLWADFIPECIYQPVNVLVKVKEKHKFRPQRGQSKKITKNKSRLILDLD